MYRGKGRSRGVMLFEGMAMRVIPQIPKPKSNITPQCHCSSTTLNHDPQIEEHYTFCVHQFRKLSFLIELPNNKILWM
jgi:hypothetical protein